MMRGPLDVLAVFRSVADGIVHVGDAALVDQVDDQLHLVQALEIRHLGRIAGLDQSFVAALDEFHEAAAEHHLLPEQIGLALLLERRLDDAGAPAADRRGVGERYFQRVARRVLCHRHQTWHAATALIFAAHGVSRAFRRDHEHVDVGARIEQVEMHVEPVRESERRAGLHVRPEFFPVKVALPFVGRQHHDDIGPFGALGRVHHAQPRRLGFRHSAGVRPQSDRELGGAAVLEIVGVRVALAAVADDGDLFSFDQVHVGIAVIVDAHGCFPSVLSRASPRPDLSRGERFIPLPLPSGEGRSEGHACCL